MGLPEGEAHRVFADVEHVAFVDLLGVDANALVFDAVGGFEVFDKELAAALDDGAVLARHVPVADGQVGDLAGATNNKLVFGDGVTLAVKDERKLLGFTGRGGRDRWGCGD